MYSKDELLSKNIAELEEIAGQIGLKIKSDDSQEDIIYSILDKQAEVEGNKNPLGTKRRRVRIVKKDTDRVYSVNGKEGENFDLKKNKVPVEAPSLFNDLPASTTAKTKTTRAKAKAKTAEQADAEQPEANGLQQPEAAVMPAKNDEIQPDNEDNSLDVVAETEESADLCGLFACADNSDFCGISRNTPVLPPAGEAGIRSRGSRPHCGGADNRRTGGEDP